MLAKVNPKKQLFEIMSQFHRFIALLLISAASLSAMSEPRIVTVGGAATEIVYALGAGDNVVAVDLSSTYPAEVQELPSVGYIRNISPEGILSMRPDMIVTTESLGPPAAKKMIKEMSLPVVWLPEPNSVEALESGIRTVAAKLGKKEQGEELINNVRAKLAESQSASANWSKRPSAIFFISPPSGSSGGRVGGSGTRAEELITLAGGENGVDFKDYQSMSLESIIVANPDVIFIGLSNSHGASPQSVEELKQNPALSGVTAVQNGAVYGVPMDDLSFGPRLGEAVARWHGHIAAAN